MTRRLLLVLLTLCIAAPPGMAAGTGGAARPPSRRIGRADLAMAARSPSRMDVVGATRDGRRERLLRIVQPKQGWAEPCRLGAAAPAFGAGRGPAPGLFQRLEVLTKWGCPPKGAPFIAHNGTWFGQLNGFGRPKLHYIRDYVRGDGTRVQGHYRGVPRNRALPIPYRFAGRVIGGLAGIATVGALVWTLIDVYHEGGWVAVGDHAVDLAIMAAAAAIELAAILGVEAAAGPPGWIALVATVIYFAVKEIINYNENVAFERGRLGIMLRLEEDRLLGR